ncbi:MAG TPA: GNAT family N-acetyltransferase [Pseudonocardiaceae bacterium]|nr:GNAT family N-acetyltransferase [Pseudonocardiaceae bacterium]
MDIAADVFLETERLVLRRFTMADEDNLFELDGDPDVMRYITGGLATPRAELRDDYLPAYLNYYRRYPGYGFWATEEKSSGQFIGWFHLRPGPDDAADVAELGYRLRKSAWGKGYATEGARALIDKAFTEFGMRRVYALTMSVNTRSRRVMEQSGLRLIRTFHLDWPYRIEGEEFGDVEYAQTKDEWAAERS